MGCHLWVAAMCPCWMINIYRLSANVPPGSSGLWMVVVISPMNGWSMVISNFSWLMFKFEISQSVCLADDLHKLLFPIFICQPNWIHVTHLSWFLTAIELDWQPESNQYIDDYWCILLRLDVYVPNPNCWSPPFQPPVVAWNPQLPFLNPHVIGSFGRQGVRESLRYLVWCWIWFLWLPRSCDVSSLVGSQCVSSKSFLHVR